jgi:hypothetical protein
MMEIVDRVLEIYQTTAKLDSERAAHSRKKIIGYIETLASAGQRDTNELAVYAMAYLKELHEGPDRRFTGC